MVDAISDGSPSRAAGTPATSLSQRRRASSSVRPSWGHRDQLVGFVAVPPGATVLMVIPNCAYSSATLLSSPTVDGRVALATVCGGVLCGSLAVADPMCTYRPQPADCMPGRTTCSMWTWL